MTEEILNSILAKALTAEVSEIKKQLKAVRKNINLWGLSPSEFRWVKNRMATLKSALVRADWMHRYISKWSMETKKSYLEAAQRNDMLNSRYSCQELQKLLSKSHK